MRMALKNGQLYIIETDNVQYQIIKSWNMMRWNRQSKWLEGAATLELLNRVHAMTRLPDTIEAERQRLLSIQKAVDAERMNENPVAIYTYPVKVPLFAHQTRAANMSMYALGFMEPKGGDALCQQ